MQNVIVHHEDWQERRYDRFLAENAIRNGILPPPAMDQVKGQIAAMVNQGRWIVACPVPGCGGAVCISRLLPLFYCPDCGNAANGRFWYEVVWPAAKAEIETILLKRPAWHPFRGAVTRNWTRETTAQLRAENLAQGIR